MENIFDYIEPTLDGFINIASNIDAFDTILLISFVCILAAVGTAVIYTIYRILKFVKHLYVDRYEIAEQLRGSIRVNNFSRLIDWCSGTKCFDYRQIFKDMSVERTIHHVQPKNHSHPEAAILRCYANTTISNFITTLGLREYSVSCSRSEQHNKIDGDRDYYHAKDLACNRQHSKLTTKHVIKMTDVDYYVDMKKYLKGHYVLLYSFVPVAVAGTTTNGTYRVTRGSNIDVHVTGGGHYVHKLWDYETDHLVVDHWWGSSFYLVEQKNISEDRRIIFLNPIRNVYSPLAWLIPGFRLRHRRLVFDNIAYIKSMTVGPQPVVKHSFACVDENTSATIEDKVLVAVKSRLTHVSKPTMSDIERIIRIDDTKDAHVLAGILFNVMINPELGSLVANNSHYAITRYTSGDNGYLPLGPLATEDGKAAMRQISAPFMLDAAHPLRSENSDRACIKGRITDVKNPVKSVPPAYYHWVDEFAKLLVPDRIANTLVPETYGYIHQQWKRLTQRNLLEKVKHVLFFEKPWAVKSFQKAEMYAKVTHPRNISTLPTGHNARGGQYAYVFAKHVLKQTHWYAFGKHPTAISDAVHRKIRGATTVVPTDLTRLDGSCGFFQTHIERTCIVRAFHRDYQAELLRIIDREANARGYTSFGVTYEAEDNTLSGSSLTSIRNSLINAGTVYIALRQTGLSPEQAFAALGIYGGDDGITCDIDKDLITKVFAKTGLVLKAEVLTEGMPIPFLGRYFIDPWTTSDSIADVPRQLRKLHMTATPANVPTQVVLRRRAEAILVTDSNTPVLSNWARAILRLIDITPAQRARYEHFIKRDLSYWSKFTDPFPPIKDRELADTVVANLFGNNLRIIILCEKFDNATTLEDMQILVDDTEPKIEIPVVMHGIIREPKVTKTHQATLRANQRIKLTPNKAAPTTTRRVTFKQPPLIKQARTSHTVNDTNTTKPPSGRAKQAAKCRYAERNQRCPRKDCIYQH